METSKERAARAKLAQIYGEDVSNWQVVVHLGRIKFRRHSCKGGDWEYLEDRS